jgi:NRAMP (natural resistance-associated macrophage protein)-like metal ion transporter
MPPTRTRLSPKRRHSVWAGRLPVHHRDEAERKGLWAQLGPGLITGASDDDPSGIATYSQAGAQFGTSMCWVMLFCYPLMCAIQEISARIGRVTGRGIAGNLREYYPRSLLAVVVVLLLGANITNLGADLGAMADAVHLLVGGPTHFYVVAFAVGCAALEIFSSYDRYVRILKWSCLTLLAYVATALVVGVDWRAVAYDTFVPNFSLGADYVTTIVGVLGTTITPYCFFWQSSEEVEDMRADSTMAALIDRPEQAPTAIKRMRIDTYLGMGYSNLVSLFIIVTTAATLHTHGITDIKTSAQAAEALRPIAGAFTYFVFAAGIIGIGLLAIPVLAGSCAYVLGEALGWTTGLGRQPREARAFYGTIAAATMIGIGINFVGIDPIKALFWSAVLNGVVAVPLMVMIMLMAMRTRVMGNFTLPRPLWAVGWICTLSMTVAVVIMFVTW